MVKKQPSPGNNDSPNILRISRDNGKSAVVYRASYLTIRLMRGRSGKASVAGSMRQFTIAVATALM